MVTHIKRPVAINGNASWVEAVRRLSDNPRSADRAITITMLLGIHFSGGDGLTIIAGGKEGYNMYGAWYTKAEAAVAYCVAEGIDIET